MAAAMAIPVSGRAAPTLTTNLANQVAISGTPLTLQVSADGAGLLSYQWYFGGVILSDATNAFLSFDSVQTTNAGRYSVQVSDSLGSTMSITNTLTVENYPLPATLMAWGDNTFGQTNISAKETNIVQIAATGYCTGFLRRDGTLGDFGYEIVSPATYANLPRAAYVCYLGAYGLMLSTSGTPVSFGVTGLSGASDVPSSLTNAVAVAGWNPGLALLDNGRVAGWHPGPIFGAGDPTKILNSISNLSNIIAISMQNNHALALAENQQVIALDNDPRSVPPAGLTGVVAISAGHDHSVALKKDGTVVAWGDNSMGQTNVLTGLTNVMAIAAGFYHSLALKSNGTIIAWGDNSAGQCNIPSGLSNVVSISAGGLNSAVLTKAPGISIVQGSQLVIEGLHFTLETYTTGYPPFNYQWQVNGTNVVGATNSTLEFPNIPFSAQGTYSVMVSNSFGSAISPVMFLGVVAPTPPRLLSPVINMNGQFQMSVLGNSGVTFVIETSTNLTDWDPLTNFLNTTGFTSFIDPIDTNTTAGQRFYRAHWTAN